jgi:hypothetical protein
MLFADAGPGGAFIWISLVILLAIVIGFIALVVMIVRKFRR